MAHKNSFESSKTAKSLSKKACAEGRCFNVGQDFFTDVTSVDKSDWAVVYETNFNRAKVLCNEETFEVLGFGSMPVNKLVYVGDIVILDADKKKILKIVKRKNVLARDTKDGTKNTDVVANKIIAANIDLAVIVVSAGAPPLHSGFIDRYLIVLDNCKIKPIICLNKYDLSGEEEEKTINIYKDLNIPVVKTSALDKSGIAKLKALLKDKHSIFVGQSGVGKSTLIKEITASNQIITGSIGEKSKRGRHITTKSKIYFEDENTWIIDTPGIRALDISQINEGEILNGFVEFEKFANCKFRDCNHYNVTEKDCGVLRAVEAGNIDKKRYQSYMRIMQSIKDNK